MKNVKKFMRKLSFWQKFKRKHKLRTMQTQSVSVTTINTPPPSPPVTITTIIDDDNDEQIHHHRHHDDISSSRSTPSPTPSRRKISINNFRQVYDRVQKYLIPGKLNVFSQVD